MINDELYRDLNNFVSQNIKEIEEKTFNKTKKKMEEEKIIEQKK